MRKRERGREGRSYKGGVREKERMCDGGSEKGSAIMAWTFGM